MSLAFKVLLKLLKSEKMGHSIDIEEKLLRWDLKRVVNGFTRKKKSKNLNLVKVWPEKATGNCSFRL